MGTEAFTHIPNGIPSVQERIDLIHTYGVKTGRIDLMTLVDSCSTQAAKIFGMYPRKGVVAPGSDADVVVYNPDAEGVFTHGDAHSKSDYSGYEGMTRLGAPHLVTLRGKVVVRDGEFTGEPGGGEYIPRTPTH